MGFTKYTDIYDPEVIMKIVGIEWLNEAKIVTSGLVGRDTRPMKGSLLSNIRVKRFQDTQGQALKAGDTISAQARTQVKANMPVIWRYGRTEEPDVVEEIEIKDVPREMEELAEDIRIASRQWVDNSYVDVIEGIASALTANQTADTGATITLKAIIDAKAKTLDKITKLDGGALIIRSSIWHQLVALGAVAQTANTYGNELQNMIVQKGVLPQTIAGLTPIVTDKIALEGGGDHYHYMVGANQLKLRGSDEPIVDVGRVNGKMSTEVKFRSVFGIGCDGINWKVAGKEDVSDTELATAANWELSPNTPSNSVSIYRFQTT